MDSYPQCHGLNEHCQSRGNSWPQAFGVGVTSSLAEPARHPLRWVSIAYPEEDISFAIVI